MALTDTACRNAKATDKPQKLSDSGGLHLFVSPSGGRLWRMAYRFDGKQKQLSFGDRPVAQIKPAEVLELLKKVEGRGTFETARRLRGICSRVFRYAVSTQKAEIDPTHPLRGALIAPKTRHHSAIIEPTAIGALLRAIYDYQGNVLTAAGLKLAAFTFVRPGELRLMEWREIDVESAVWSIPAKRMKMRRPHKVPLARQALTVLDEIRPFTGKGRFVFPSLRSDDRGMSENTLNAALRRMGFDKGEMTSHGFRAMAATRLNEMGLWSVDSIERQLAHQEANAIRRAYTHAAEYWDERVRMMQVWADYLDELRTAPAKKG